LISSRLAHARRGRSGLQTLRRLGKQWQHELPGLGRLRTHATQHGIEQLNLGEIVCRPASLPRPEWGEAEAGLVFSLRSVIVKPATPLVDHTWNIATCGLHALSRCFERAGEASDRVILAELFNNVARHWPEHLAERPHAFSENRWLIEFGGADHTLNARSYLPGGFKFVDASGRLRASWDGPE
jgi:hypothetical protein